MRDFSNTWWLIICFKCSPLTSSRGGCLRIDIFNFEYWGPRPFRLPFLVKLCYDGESYRSISTTCRWIFSEPCGSRNWIWLFTRKLTSGQEGKSFRGAVSVKKIYTCTLTKNASLQTKRVRTNGLVPVSVLVASRTKALHSDVINWFKQFNFVGECPGAIFAENLDDFAMRSEEKSLKCSVRNFQNSPGINAISAKKFGYVDVGT